MQNNFLNANWQGRSQVRTLITTKHGNNHHHLGFNLANHVGDDSDIVLQNRTLLNNVLPSKPYWLNQTHSSNVLNLDIIDKQLSDDMANYGNFDAAFTTLQQHVCVVMTADCLPILLTDAKASFVAAIHAGRVGLENNIIANTIKAINSNYEIIAYIGPSICAKHYEVGGDTFANFEHINLDFAQAFTRRDNHHDNQYAKDTKYDCDLTKIATLQLINCHVTPAHIYTANICTYCQHQDFFSYRHNAHTGRFATLIWLE